MRKILAVLRYRNSAKENCLLVMHEETILVLANLLKNGADYLFAVPQETAPASCPHCGSPVKSVCDVDDEPASVSYECGLLVLQDYARAEYAPCKSTKPS